MTFQQHIDYLAKFFCIGIKTPIVREVPNSNIDTRTITAHPATNVISYITALHEMGHILNSPTNGSIIDVIFCNLFGIVTTSVLQREKMAWDWAKKFAMDGWTDEMQKLMQTLYSSYELGYELLTCSRSRTMEVKHALDKVKAEIMILNEIAAGRRVSLDTPAS